MANMQILSLVLKYKLSGDKQLHVKEAVRIKVDGRGGLVLYDAQNARAEAIELGQLQSLSIHPVTGAHCTVM
jgi:hypothetical protein